MSNKKKGINTESGIESIKKLIKGMSDESKNVKEVKNISAQSDMLNKFQARFSFDVDLNRPMFKIFSDYFNILKENSELQKKHGIKVIGLFRDNEFKDTINLYDNFGKKEVLLGYKDLVINLSFDIYKQHSEVHFYLCISSNEKTYIDGESFFNKLWAHAVDVSDLKGGYFTMQRDEILWSKKKIEKRSFSDIYLPKSTIEDLKLYVATNSELGKMMRYLMVGNPGTGKTESTLVLANELNKMGVTIIKTPVCSMIKEKVELATLLAPSLIIFDDIDLSLGSRKSGVYSERLQDFLDVLDGTDKLLDSVGMIATTNSVALLDMAAQRPGRFDKVLSFDELTLDNIKNIIIKSLKYNFDVSSSATIKIFTDNKILKLFHDSRVTGAHIFNSIKMLKMRLDLLKIKTTVDVIFNEITKEIKTIEKIRKADYLSDKISGSNSGSIGFNQAEDDDNEDSTVPEPEENYVEKTEERRPYRRTSNRLTMEDARKIAQDESIFD